MNLSRVLRTSAAVGAVFLVLAGASAEALDLNPFHRRTDQIAQDVPPGDVPGAAADNDAAAALVLRVDQLEAALRQANGRIEELQNQQRRTEEQFRKFREDVEFRLSGRSGAAPLASATPAAPPTAAAEATPLQRPRRNDAFDPNADPRAVGAPQPLGSTAASAPLAKAPSAGAPLDLATRPPMQTAPIEAAPQTASTGPTVTGTGVSLVDGPRDDFNAALASFRNGQYELAETQFKAFLSANTSHRLAPDAIFYLGETYFQRSRPREAAEQYLRISTNFSKSARAPESMVRLGMSLAALGNNEQACATLGEVGKRYPGAATAVKKLAEREMLKNHC